MLYHLSHQFSIKIFQIQTIMNLLNKKNKQTSIQWDKHSWGLPDSSIHGIFQARILEWVATLKSRLAQGRNLSGENSRGVTVPLPSRVTPSRASRICGYHSHSGFPGGSDGKQSACNAGDLSSIPGWEGSPGEGNGNPLQYSCLENAMDEGAWQATAHRVTKSQMRLSDYTLTPIYHRDSGL